MRSRPVRGVVSVLVTALPLALVEAVALADEPPKTPPAVPAPPAAAPAPLPQAQRGGAVVVAIAEGAGPAARALAFDVYRDPELRPAIDDATARVLVGDAPAEGASLRLKEIAELRASIARTFGTGAPAPPAPPASPPAPASDLVARRLAASLGTELGAALVVTVSLDGTRPVARVLRPTTAAFERVELGPTVEIAADGAKTYRWPGATTTLRGFMPAPPSPPPSPAPLAPKAEVSTPPPVPAEPRPFYKSPWFWGSVGGAAAIGLSVFLISRATSSPSDVHLVGKVGP
jgi:hypothetical protein